MKLETRTHKLFVARPEAAANTTFSDSLATEGDFAHKPDDAIDVLDLIRLDPTVGSTKDPKVFADTIVNGLVLYFAGGNADDNAFTWKVYAWRNENGPAQIVADGTGTLGSQAVVKYPHNGATATSKFWADTLEVTNDRWIKEIESTDTVGGNSVSNIWFDIAGARYFYIEIPSSVGDMSCYLGYF